MITTPIPTIHQLTSRPTSAHATPTATPMGQRLSTCACCSGTCSDWSTARLASGSPAGSIQSSRISPANVVTGASIAETVLAPAAVDAGLDVGRHLDLFRPRPRVLLRQLMGGVDPELAAVELPPRRVVEMVERALGDEDVALRIDVRGHTKEHVLVVVDVHVLVDDDDRLREREHPQAPDRVHDLLGMAG